MEVAITKIKILTAGCQKLLSHNKKEKFMHNIFVRFQRGVECDSVE